MISVNMILSLLKLFHTRTHPTVVVKPLRTRQTGFATEVTCFSLRTNLTILTDNIIDQREQFMQQKTGVINKFYMVNKNGYNGV